MEYVCLSHATIVSLGVLSGTISRDKTIIRSKCIPSVVGLEDQDKSKLNS